MLRRVLFASFALGLVVGCDSATSGDGASSGTAGTGGTTGGTGGATGGTAGATGGTGGATGGSGGTGGSSGTGTGGSEAGKGGSAGTSGGSAGASGGSAGTTGGASGTGGSNAGSGGTSGAGTAGTNTGGGAGTSSGGPCDAALFCDDFESYTSGQAPGGMWAARTNAGGAVAIDTAQKASGSQSVKFTTMGSDSSRQAMIRLMDQSVFPVTGNAYYGRMMFRLDSAPTASVHWTIIAGGGVVPGETYHALYRYGGQHPVMGSSQLMANYETPDWYSNKQTPGSDCWKHAANEVIPVGTFTCVEWHFDGPNNTMHLWLDGEAIDGATVTGTGEGCVNAAANFEWTAPTFDTLDLGWEAYQTDEPRTAWIDDVVLSTTRVGCP